MAFLPITIPSLPILIFTPRYPKKIIFPISFPCTILSERALNTMGGSRETFSTEEVHASGKTVRKETGQASKQRENEENAKSTGSWSCRMGPEDSKGSRKWPWIPEVPRMLRGTKDFKKHFEPRVVSVGPYHHHKQELKEAEALKGEMANRFIEENKLTNCALYERIEKEISDLRNCYKENATKKYKDEDLASMMLLDGCSLLDYIHRSATKRKLDLKIGQNPSCAAFVQQDLFLLENQIPFRVLELLLESSIEKDERMQSIEKFIFLIINGWEEEPSKVTPDPKEEKPSHLLDLLRRRLLGNEVDTKKADVKGWYSFRNVNQLKAAGIRFKPNKPVSLGNISFKSYLFYADLKLPPITIDDLTKSRFLNLIAYEMCSDSEDPNYLKVTSYVCFLDSLIDHPEDVKELKHQRILRNLLGSDEEVATLFNEITTDLVPDLYAYADVKEAIQKHYEKAVSRWVTQGLHDHFSSPWTVLAFLGAVLALFFNGLQTYFTVFPPRN